MENSTIIYGVKVKNNSFSLKKRFQSFRYAFNGLRVLFRFEHNSRVYLLCAISVVALGFILHISIPEWLAILILTGMVFILEIINSSIEHLADFVSPGYSEKIKIVKDLAAAAVLVAAIVAVITGLIIFVPKIF